MRAAILVLLALCVSACTTEITRVTINLKRPVDMAVVCEAPAGCDDGGGLVGYVVNSEQGGVARLDLETGEFLDEDPFIPGRSPIPLVGRPASIVADGRVLYVADPAASSLAKVDPRELDRESKHPGASVTEQALPGRPTDVVVAGSDVLVALPDQGVVARIPTDQVGELASIDSIPVGGTPYDLAWDGDDTLWVGHADEPWVSRVDLSTGLETGRVGIADACEDGLDNDGDGDVDGGDWGCRWTADGVEATAPADWTMPEIPALPEGSGLPRCMNGADDDGDGLADFPEDPDCAGPTGSLEALSPAPALVRVAISPGGDAVYALDRRHRTLEVIDPVAAERVDVNAEGQPGANRLLRRLGRVGVRVSSAPLDVAAVQLEDPEGEVRLYVARTSGTILVLDGISADGEWLHRLLDSDETEESTVLPDPRLFDGDKELTLGGNRRSDQPSFGEFVRSQDFGIGLNQDEPRVATNETWSVTHAGAILERTARIGALDAESGDFVTPEAAFCRGGVETGDLLVVHHTPADDCPDFEGQRFAWTITSVTERRLSLDGQSGVVIEGADGAAELAVCAADAECSGDGRVCSFGRCRQPVGAMTSDCFGDAMAYSVHVPAGTYAVTGTVSGYLHSWTGDADGLCVQDPADTDFVGRAVEWTPVPGAATTACPPSDAQADDAFDGERFESHALNLRVLPGCSVEETSGEIRVMPTGFEIRWQFTVDSTFGARRIGGRPPEPTIGVPRSLRYSAVNGRLYAVDSGQEKVVEITTGADTIRKTIF